VKATIYRDHPHADAQHEIALVEVAAVYVFHNEFQQRRILNIFRQVAGKRHIHKQSDKFLTS
jgi:hypothetical protein